MTETTATPAPGATSLAPRDRVFWGAFLLIVALDVASKRWAEAALQLHLPEEVFGTWIRWTLSYNTGAAMNLSVGTASRVVFSVIAIVMLGYLFYLYRQTARHERATPAALGMIAAGALGNLIDRLRHASGVVDFIDIGTVDWRFWTFNVADMGVTVGAFFLAILLWREDRAAATTPPLSTTTPDHTPIP